MNLVCRIFGHGSPWKKDIKYLGHTFILEYCFCPRCGILEETQFLQRMFSVTLNRFIWCNMFYRYGDSEYGMFPLVYDPTDEEFKGWNKGGGWETKRLLSSMRREKIPVMSGAMPQLLDG